jgi:hypothetical protein
VFPGYAALWPTLGAICVIAAGASGSSIGADRLLASRPFAYLGGISYSLYLWHWPVLVFYRTHAETTQLTAIEGLGVLGTAVLLSALTTRFVENPIRWSRIGEGNPSRALALGAACLSCVLLAVALWSALLLHLRASDGPVAQLSDTRYPGAQALNGIYNLEDLPDAPVRPGPFAIRNDVPSTYADGCHQETEESTALSCDYGSPDASVVIAMVGGSHSAHWLPALQIVAKRQGWRIVTFTKSSCLLSSGAQYRVDGKPYPTCTEWNENVISELRQLRPDIVFTTSTTGKVGDGQSESLPQGVLEAWRRLGHDGLNVVAIRDNPWMGFDVSECVERHGARSPRCARPRDSVLARLSPVEALLNRPQNVYFLDLSKYFCSDTSCFPVAGNVMIYRDRHHISASYSRSLAPVLEREMVAALRQFKPVESAAKVN